MAEKDYTTKAGRGQKPQAPVSPKLNDYDPKYANAKVSVVALWKHLEDLKAKASDPVKVKNWARKIYFEVLKCKVCVR